MSNVHVLVPLDGSAEADRAVDVVAGLKPAKATLLHAADGTAVAGSYFDGAAARLKSAGVISVERRTQAGDAAKVILEGASACGAGLIALSMHGRSGWNLLRLGTVAEQVIRSATVPVLALPKGEGAAPGGLLDRVLCPQDGSAVAESALKRLLGLFPGAAPGLTLLGVVECYAGPASLGGTDVASRFYQMQADELKGLLGKAANAAGLPGGAGAPGRVKIELGRPASKILDGAASGRSTLIAMATHGRSGLTRWTLGSVTEQVLRASPLPVLVVR